MHQTGITLPGGKTELKVDGSGTGVKENGIVITPTAMFAIKTRKLKSETKMFINVCYHETIDKPGQKKKLDDKGNEVDGLNVPLSVGPIRTSPDRAGNLCLAVDAVVNPSVNVDIMHDRSGSHRDFVCLLLIQCVEQKYFEKNGNLDRKYRLPQLRYFGYVDKKTGMVVPRASENAKICEQVVKDTRKKPKIEEVIKSSTKAKPSVVLSKDKLTSQLDIQIYIRLANGKEITIDDFIDKVKPALTTSSNNTAVDSIDLSNFVHRACTAESFKLSLPFLIDPDISDGMVVDSIICRSILAGIDAKTLRVEVSTFSLSISGPNFPQTERNFPFCVIPHSCECIFCEETSSFELSASISSIGMEESSDIGSQSWLFIDALSNGEMDGEKIAGKDEIVGEQDWETRRICETDSNIDEDPYQVRPGRLWNKTSSDSQSITKDSFPEDNFHSKDVVSRHLKQQQQAERKDKKEQVEKNRQEREQDDSVEYLSPDDFKLGGKYYTGEHDINEQTNDMNSGDSPERSLKAAERVFQKNVVNSFRNNLWLQLA